MTGNQLPYAMKFADYTLDDPGDAGVIGCNPKGKSLYNFRTAAAETRTLRAPDHEGDEITLFMQVDGGDLTVTVKDSAGTTTDTFVLDDAGDFVTLRAHKVGTVFTWYEIDSLGVGGVEGASFDTITVNSSITFSAAGDIIAPANTAAALELSDGTTKVLVLDTRNTVKDVSNVKINPVAPTIATEAAAHLNPSLQIAAKTVTYTGTATVTSSHGVGLHIGIPTFTDAGAGTLSLTSNLYVAAVAAAGGSLTITAARMIGTGVSDCYLTNAGVWTDTACWSYGKEMVSYAADSAYDAIEAMLAKIVPATWQYRDTFEVIDAETGLPVEMHMNDLGRQRVGIVYDDLPGELRAPGEERGVAPGILASFGLAAIKMLSDRLSALTERNQQLEARLTALGG